MVRRLLHCFVSEYLGYFRFLCAVYKFANVFYINRWKISFIKTDKYVFADLFNSNLTITNRFGKFAIWQTSVRKKLDSNFKDDVNNHTDENRN